MCRPAVARRPTWLERTPRSASSTRSRAARVWERGEARAIGGRLPWVGWSAAPAGSFSDASWTGPPLQGGSGRRRSAERPHPNAGRGVRGRVTPAAHHAHGEGSAGSVKHIQHGAAGSRSARAIAPNGMGLLLPPTEAASFVGCGSLAAAFPHSTTPPLLTGGHTPLLVIQEPRTSCRPRHVRRPARKAAARLPQPIKGHIILRGVGRLGGLGGGGAGALPIGEPLGARPAVTPAPSQTPGPLGRRGP